MTKPQDDEIVIGSDVPQTDPAHDAFGYSAFALRIADAVRKTPSPHGLVMAIHGPWGSGKSSLLNFIKHNLNILPNSEKPIVIDFNPWWFTNSEQLATQFLNQFRAKLPQESEALRKIGDAMADYATTIGSTIAGLYGIPFLDKVIGFTLGLLKRKPKDVQALKQEISNVLKNEGQRFIIIIDDIDRLTPDEIRELFKVIKAVADFPNVIYLLSFDRKVVSEALFASLGVNGEAYLEKIIQAPFSLPAIDRLLLRKKLFADLDIILNSSPLLEFNQTYWANIYYEGLDQYIRMPRDVVRIINTLCVTYPAVAGEVNPIDFVALEFLRLFEPEVYSVIRENKDMFAGYIDHGYSRNVESEKKFHSAWLGQVHESRQSEVQNLSQRLFPKLESVWNNISYSSDRLSDWRRDQRLCSPDLFDFYFQFGVPKDSLRRSDLNELIAIAPEPEMAICILKSASSIKRPDGTSKASEYLDWIRDLKDEISPDAAKGLLYALFEIGDALLTPADEGVGMLSTPNRLRLIWTVKHLFRRIQEGSRTELLKLLISEGQAVCLIVQIVGEIERFINKPKEYSDFPFSHIDESGFSDIKTIVSDRLNLINVNEVLAIPEIIYVIHKWTAWSGNQTVTARISPILSSEELFPVLLEKHLTWGTRQTSGDIAIQRVPHLNPKYFEPIADIYALESQVEKMLQRVDLTSDQRTAGEQYLKNMERIKQGKDPDGFFSDD
ncbi:MAG: KAP family P-loop NTPase fold protein [Desulfuromonadaceae bacterium]